MFAVAAGVGVWSLVAAWMLRAGQVKPGDVWGSSALGNVLQGTGLIFLAAGILFTNELAAWAPPGESLIRHGPWAIVGIGVALRVRARRRL